MKSLAKPHPRTTRVWGRCALEAISCGKCHGRVPSPFPGGCQMVPTSVRYARSDPTLPSLTGKPTVDSCGLSTKRRVHVSRDAGAHVSLGARTSTHFCLEDRWRACANPRSGRLPAFSCPLSRCSPLSSHAPRLPMVCADGSSHARRTISVLSLHR
jgi:hypothetical protein